MAITKTDRRDKIRRKIRGSISGTAARPRLSVFRSNKQIYAQLIDDVAGKTLLATSSAKLDVKTNKIDIASIVGKTLAEKAVEFGIKEVVFDRGGYLYHGRIKSLAEGAREGGLVF